MDMPNLSIEEMRPLLGSAIDAEPEPAFAPRAKGTPPSMSAGQHSNFAQAVLDAECEIVASTPEGQRNPQLSASAFAVGHRIHLGLDEHVAASQLLAAALQCGLPESEALDCIARGLRDGMQEPKDPANSTEGTRRVSQSGANTTSSNPNGNKPASFIVDSPEPLRLAELFIEKFTSVDDLPGLVRNRDEFFRYTRGQGYQAVSDESLKSMIYRFLDRVITPKRDSGGVGEMDSESKPKFKKLVAKKSLADEVVKAIIACTDVLVLDDPPVWLRESAKKGDPSKVIALRNGLLDVATRTLHPPTPAFFSTSALPFAYEPYAGEPRTWLEFLSQLFLDDHESIRTLQQWFGYCLTSETHLQKILLLIGPPRSGKGTVATVLSALLGSGNVAGPTLGSLSTNFALAPLLNKTLAIVSDARLSGRSDQSAIIENLLRISGEDLVTVDRKYTTAIETRLKTRFLMLTNELPRLTDNSGALFRRFVVLRLTESFLGREDHRLKDRLFAELPAVFNWAVEGWQDLKRKGRLIQPESATELIGTFEALSSPISSFLSECCKVGPEYSVKCSGLFEEWRRWCAKIGREHPGATHTFSRDLHAAVSGLRVSNRRIDQNTRARCYEGIGLL